MLKPMLGEIQPIESNPSGMELEEVADLME